MSIESIGRFKIIRELGRGGQGVVYLAQDTQLGRRVAIKVLRPERSQQTDQLVREARIASNLQHPNVVTLYDAAEHDGTSYLVYAYVEGLTLAQLLKQEKILSLTKAVHIACGVLDGLACAHAQGVMHLDIKPANIMITSTGQPMVMDFGIARMITHLHDASGGILGTPQYMAPECMSVQGPEFASDLFSVGMILYEMVTGSPAVEDGNVYEILHRNASEPAPAPSTRNPEVDERLEGIILRAIAKNPRERYPDAVAMRQALMQYLSEKSAAGEGVSHSTLEFLMRRMRSKSDFPALSNAISEINRIASSESVSASNLTQLILQDFALTNKLLKLVNAASYGQFGGTIHTVSKAVSILGFEMVRSIATSLILLESLQNNLQAAELKDEIAVAFFAGVVAAELSRDNQINAEEARVCAMFHNLGRMLAVYYLFEESQQIAQLMDEQGIDEESAAVQVIGLSYNELSIGVAKSWNFPEQILAGMRKLSAENIKKPKNMLDQLGITVNLANELCTIAVVTKPEEKEEALNQLCKRYEHAVVLSKPMLAEVLDNSLLELSKRSGILGISMAKSALLKKIRKWSGHVETAKPAAPPEESPLQGVVLLDTTTIMGAPGAGGAVTYDPEAMLGAGIQDVTNTLVGEYNVNEVLHMVLETMYRSLGFKHTLIFIRDNKQNLMAARYGFGETVEAIIPKLRFPLEFEPDVFHLSIDQGVDIFIKDVQASNIAGKIPAWFRNVVDAQCFLLLPVAVNRTAIGLIYADIQEANSLQITQNQLALLRTLRNQAILAIKQKY